VLHQIEAEKTPVACTEFAESTKNQESVVFEPAVGNYDGTGTQFETPFDKNTCKHFVHHFFGSAK